LSQLLAALSSVLGSFSRVPVIYGSITQMVAWEDMQQAIHDLRHELLFDIVFHMPSCFLNITALLPRLQPSPSRVMTFCPLILIMLMPEGSWPTCL
jgi:hypothetical protein